MNFDAIERVNDTSRTAAERTQASEIAQAAVQLGSVMNVSTSLGIDSSDVVKNLGIKISSDPGQAAQFDLREKLSTDSEIEDILGINEIGNPLLVPALKVGAAQLALTNDQIRRQSGTGGMAAEQGKLFSTVGIGARPGPAPRPGPFSVKKEQGQNVFNVSLKRTPTDDVQIDISIDNPDSLVLNEDFLEFDATNWSQPQTVTISVEEDAEVVNFSPREIIFSISEDFTDDDTFLEMDSESFPFAIRPSGLQGDIRAERLLAENFGDPVSYNGKECKIYGSLETLGQYADTDDVIGVYVGDELRGKISTIAFSEIGFFEGAIAVKADGEVATFKVFDASMGEILEVPDYSVSLESGAEIGSSTDPVSLTAGYSLDDVIFDPRGPRKAGASAVASMAFKTVPERSVRFGVRIDVTPEDGTLDYSVEESVPVGLTVHPEAISDNGVWDPTNRKVRWGPFFDDATRLFSYELTTPEGASEALVFQGIFSTDGKDTSISGNRLLSARPAQQDYAGWKQQAFVDPETVETVKEGINSKGTSNLLSYALGWENAEDGPLPELEPEFVDENGNEGICFIFQKSKTASNLYYSVEVSDSPQKPEAVIGLEQAELVGETDRAWIYMVVLDTPSSPKPRCFARLRVTELN